MSMLNVLTYNILGFSKDAASDSDRRKCLIAQELEKSDFDVVFLQEVKTNFSADRNITHSSESFFRRCDSYKNGCFFIYADQRAVSKNAEGLMTRKNVKDFQFGNLPQGLFGRAFLMVKIELEHGEIVNLITTHLEPPAIGRMITQYGATEEIQNKRRITQLLFLENLVNNLPKEEAVIVGGDFNMELTTPEFQLWKDRLHFFNVLPENDLPHKTFATHPSPSFDVGMDLRLDHIFFRSGTDVALSLKSEGYFFDMPVGNHDELFYGFLSDHRGLYGKFEVTRGEK